ncbi:hypothetical protein BSKO_14083 [Bryopsis sp. KO-2023]|nr:hypothetical protein BSKO_14083 [Bryopsis sp. KO-2023]
MKPVDPGRPMHVPSKVPHVEGEPAPKAPEGKEYVLESEFPTVGILLAIFLFPIGIVYLLVMRRRFWVLVDPQDPARSWFWVLVDPQDPGWSWFWVLLDPQDPATSKHPTGNASNNHESGKAGSRDMELGGKCAEHQSSKDINSQGMAMGQILINLAYLVVLSLAVSVFNLMTCAWIEMGFVAPSAVDLEEDSMGGLFMVEGALWWFMMVILKSVSLQGDLLYSVFKTEKKPLI